jgi:hypothetical protein
MKVAASISRIGADSGVSAAGCAQVIEPTRRCHASSLPSMPMNAAHRRNDAPLRPLALGGALLWGLLELLALWRSRWARRG